MAGYIYNPAESIRQDFQQAQSGLGSIFTQIIQQQQRDFTLAESTFANIEALKKDINIYGQKSITSKANNLLGHASAAILENGKLDYGKLGEIRQAVSDIKDLKTGYDLAAKEFEKNLQLGASTKEDFTSFEKYYRDINGLMNDENLIKNPRDLQVAFSKVYTNNLDSNKKFIKTFGSIAPYTPVKKEIDNAKGGKTLVQVEAPQGWEVNENGANMPTMYSITNADGSVTQIPYLTYITERIKAQDPTLIPLMREKFGASVSGLSDEKIIEFNIKNQIKIPTTIVESKTKAQLDADIAEAKTKTIQANYAEDVITADLAAKKASTQASRAQTAYYGTQTNLLNNPQSNDYFYDESGRPRLNFGSQSPKIDLPLFGTDKVQKVAVSEIGYDKYGKPYISYYVPKAGESVDDMIKNNMATGIRKTASLPANILKSQTFYNMTKGLVGKNQARTLSLLKQFPSLPSMPTASAALPGTGKRIDKASLGTMYGTGKQYQTEAEAAGAAKALGYTVDGY